MSAIHVTFDGDTHWLECFAADLNAERGEIIHPIDAGDKWDDIAALVRDHQAEHGCGEPAQAAPELAAAMAERDDLRDQLAAADRATAEFRRQCSELAGELGAARAVVRDIRTHLADAGIEVDEELQDAWWAGAGIEAGQ